MYFVLELVKREGPLTGQQGEGLLLEGRCHAMLTGPKSRPVRARRIVERGQRYENPALCAEPSQALRKRVRLIIAMDSSGSTSPISVTVIRSVPSSL
jgi:hypothetical protein